ncbi:UNVERIFIED_CONTAM: hypothetical protein K2H54_026551 [Gekko kuhli]
MLSSAEYAILVDLASREQVYPSQSTVLIDLASRGQVYPPLSTFSFGEQFTIGRPGLGLSPCTDPRQAELLGRLVPTQTYLLGWVPVATVAVPEEPQLSRWRWTTWHYAGRGLSQDRHWAQLVQQTRCRHGSRRQQWGGRRWAVWTHPPQQILSQGAVAITAAPRQPWLRSAGSNGRAELAPAAAASGALQPPNAAGER